MGKRFNPELEDIGAKVLKDKKPREKSAEQLAKASGRLQPWLSRIGGLSLTEYKQTKHWRKKRLQALQHYHAKCAGCGQTVGVDGVFHKRFESFGRERMEDLILQCQRCLIRGRQEEPGPSIVVYADGGCIPNPGHAAAAYVIYRLGKFVTKFDRYLGDNYTNNYAEYEGLILALDELRRLEMTEERIEIRMDSLLIIRCMIGRYRVHSPSLLPRYQIACQLLKDFKSVQFVHIPREQNTEADALASEAIQRRGN